MPHYFYSIDAALFQERVRPALGRCWRERSFGPARALCLELLPRVAAYQRDYHGLAEPTLLEQAARQLSFDRGTWRALAGEVLVFAADELPLVQVAAESLCCLLAPGQTAPQLERAEFAPICQVLFGSRDLDFGGRRYRPEAAGWNDVDDVRRLSAYLDGVDPADWHAAQLAGMEGCADADEQAEELEFSRENWPNLVGVYRRARGCSQVIACEI